MAFGKNAPAPKPTQVVNIPEGTVFTGNVTAANPVRVDGELNGNMTTESSVAVGPASQVKGNITAGDVTIGGAVAGDILSSGAVIIVSPGSLKGNVKAKGFSVESGSVFSGQCEISPDSSALYLPVGEN